MAVEGVVVEHYDPKIREGEARRVCGGDLTGQLWHSSRITKRLSSSIVMVRAPALSRSVYPPDVRSRRLVRSTFSLGPWTRAAPWKRGSRRRNS